MNNQIKYLNSKGEWIGEVAQRRAERAVSEEAVDTSSFSDDLASVIVFKNTRENLMYWSAVYHNVPEPDQYLPKGYVDVEDSPILEAREMAGKKIERAKSVMVSPATPEPSEQELRELFKKHADKPVYFTRSDDPDAHYMSEDMFVEVVKELLTTQRG